MPRVIYPLRRLTLTKLKVKGVMRGCRTGTLKKLNKEADVATAFKKTPVAVKMAKYSTRKKLTDYERFQVMILRKQRSYKATHLNAKPSVVHKKKNVAPEPKKEEEKAPEKGKGKVPQSPKMKKQKTKKGKKGE